MDDRAIVPGDLAQLSVEELVQRVQQAYTHYCRTGTSDGRFAYELFRRAIEDRHEQCWQVLLEQYSPVVATWIQKIAVGKWLITHRRESLGVLVNACFLNFFIAMRQTGKLQQFSTLASLLSYLHKCVRSVVYDAFVAQKTHWEHEPLEAVICDDPTGVVEKTQTARKLWQLIRDRLRSHQERIVLICIYWDMKPREISKAYPDLFLTPEEVYRVKQNMLARLRQDPQLHLALQDMLAS